MLQTYPHWSEVNAMTQEERREFTERYIGDCAVAIDESWAKRVLARDKELRQLKG